MRNIRIYADTPISVSARVVLPGQASHRLLRALRCRRGDEITLFNGKGGSFSGRIVSDTGRAAEVDILDFQPETSASTPPLTLALGISRGARMDYAVQKSVELGVSTIAPLFTERTEVKLDARRGQMRLEHWGKIIIHACEQSGRNILPALQTPQPLYEWLAQDTDTTRFLLDPGARQTLATVREIDDAGVILLIGPEGGFTEAERNAAAQQGCIPVQLGPRTLRAETAAVAALTAVQVLWGDLR